ncbi:MAG: 2-oxoglutarate and iron-dependent oxygenase domain-containing protein [Kineosporiaceae bacterium]
MPVSDFTAVPIVDIAPLLASYDDPEQAAAAHVAVAVELGRAAREVGFLYVTGGMPPQEVIDGLLGATEAFFALPEADKRRTYIGDSGNHRGYVPIGEEVFAGGTPDLKEAFDLVPDLPRPDGAAPHPFEGANRWPDVPGVPFEQAVMRYYDHVIGVARALFRGFALALGEPADAFDAHLQAPPSQLRLLHYPADPSRVDRPGIGAHTDYECFTLLMATTPGLEVLNGAGQWIDAPPVDGAFVVNIGDMLQTWTNGEFVATTHRVRKVTSERYSFPLFCSLDYWTVVEPLPRFVDERGPLYPRVVAGEHIWAQTIQTFTYLRDRLAAGTLELPDGSHALAAFGRVEAEVG